MRDTLKTEGYVPVPPETARDPFFKMARVIKEEIRTLKWEQGENGHTITWEEAHRLWIRQNEHKIEAFIHTILEREPAH